MAWRNPQYMFLHAARDAGASAITPTPSADADFPVDYLIDDRAGSLFKFGSSSGSAKIEIDRGSGTLEVVDRIIIPSGHNIGGTTITVQADSSAGFPSPSTLLVAAVSAGLIDESLFDNNLRYIRISISTTGTWELPELIFTHTRELTRGPDPEWIDRKRSNTLVFEKESGASALLSLGADRREFEFEYRGVDDADSTDDLALLLELISAVGTSRPFYLDPPFDTEGVIWVVRTEDGDDGHEGLVPAATDAPVKQITLSMLEWLT